ncbi:helix-turn-helix domain-containing protein [Streptomyces sp. NBC_00365]|jgi:transcriptional regulator with XRE-family HTH domain|uniref:helix-turn-helix domain-containing protein n=1 Tax=unclassified Streptomyces TaxID=2593676 RepID=UPI002259B126|nr:MULTISPECIES: helix-turn-helix transcriptional regulator [unclassified Streptomyces]MCX5094173.1 helix-turn-helix domain-containing protein [Streptomyces sp. NBC_00365]
MVRNPLTPEERERGECLGRLLREARGGRSMVEVAATAGISAETLRKIETGRAPTPAFFTVAALARALGLSMDDLDHRTLRSARKLPVAIP